MAERSLEELIRFMLDLDEINGKILFLLVGQIGSPATLSDLVQMLNDDPTISKIDIHELENRLHYLVSQGLIDLDIRKQIVHLKDSPESFLMPNITKLQSAVNMLSERYFFRKYSFRPFAHFKEKARLIERLLFTVQDAQPGDDIYIVFSRFSSLSIPDVQRNLNNLGRAGINFHFFLSINYILSSPRKAEGFIFLCDLKKHFPQNTHLYNYKEDYSFFDEAKFLVVDGPAIHRVLFVIDDHDEHGNLAGALGYVTEHSGTVACFKRYFQILIWSGECNELSEEDLHEVLIRVLENR